MSISPAADWILRVLQLVFGLVAAVLFGIDLRRPTETNSVASSSWIYAEVIVAISIMNATIQFYRPQKHAAWCFWDWVVFILWVSLARYFTLKCSFERKPATDDVDAALAKLRAALSIDWLNLILWLLSANNGSFTISIWSGSRPMSDPIELGLQAVASQESSTDDCSRHEQDKTELQKDSNSR